MKMLPLALAVLLLSPVASAADSAPAEPKKGACDRAAASVVAAFRLEFADPKSKTLEADLRKVTAVLEPMIAAECSKLKLEASDGKALECLAKPGAVRELMKDTNCGMAKATMTKWREASFAAYRAK